MTAKEKCDNLMQRFQIASEAKFTEMEKLMQQKKVLVCALICSNEVLLEAKGYRYKYWKDVIKELKKL